MRKKILIGSMLVLALLLLMPSIPAVQQKTIEHKTYSDFVEKFGDFDADFIELLKDVDLEDIGVLDVLMKLPILFIFVYSISLLLASMTDIMFIIAFPDGFYGGLKHPLFLLPGFILLCITVAWVSNWMFLSEALDWDWNWYP